MGGSRREVASFGQLLRERAARSPDVIAYRFVDEDGSAEEITYGQLDERAGAVAAAVLAAGTRTSTGTGAGRPGPALLLYAPGPDYLAGLFGCFYAGVPAVPAFPPDPTRLARTLPRLAAILDDAGSDLVLTTSGIAPLLREWLPAARAGSTPAVLTTDLAGAQDAPAPADRPDLLAVLQYTSGSTALPRGVMLTHDHLVRNCVEIVDRFGVHRDSSGALWLPPYHDMGLIGGILAPLVSGIPVTLMSPVTFLRHPLSWLRMVSRYRATVTGGPNFAYDLCVRRAATADLDGLDLSTVELTFTGAEPVRAETLTRFAECFAPYGFQAESFYPCYGLAEATLFVTGAAPLRGWRQVQAAREALERGTARPAGPGEPSRTVVSCGTPGPDTRLLVVDPATRRALGEGAVGEIWIGSPCVAGGYWRRPAETAATFGARTAACDGPFMRTGDLGFLLDGELFVTGRTKDLIVINGRNYHPVDIERACETSVVGIRRNCGAAFAVEDAGAAAERLVLVYEADPGGEEQHRAAIDGIRRAVSMELNVAPYTVVLVRPRTIPRTSSGKVQRWLARRQFLAGEMEELARWQAPARPATVRELAG